MFTEIFNCFSFCSILVHLVYYYLCTSYVNLKYETVVSGKVEVQVPFVATFNQKKCDRPTLKLESKNLCEIITTTFNINITRMHHLVVLYLRFRNQSGCCLTLSLRLSESFFSCPSFYWSHGLDTPMHQPNMLWFYYSRHYCLDTYCDQFKNSK